MILVVRLVKAPYELLDRHVVDILTRHASAQLPLLPPRLPSGPSLFLFSHAWLTPSAFSSTIPLPPSPTSPLPTHSQYLTSSRAGTHAFPYPPARHSPVSREMVPVSMSHPWTVLLFPSNGGVRHHVPFFKSPFVSICLSLQEMPFNYPVSPKVPSHTT